MKKIIFSFFLASFCYFLFGIQLISAYTSIDLSSLRVSPSKRVQEYHKDAEYVISANPSISINVTSNQNLFQCVYVFKDLNSGVVANLAMDVTHTTGNEYKCLLNFSNFRNYGLVDGGWYEIISMSIYDEEANRVDFNLGHTFSVDLKPPSLRFVRAKKNVWDLNGDRPGLLIKLYVEGDDQGGSGAMHGHVYYSFNGGLWRKLDQVFGLADLAINNNIPYEFLASANGVYEFYIIGEDYLGNIQQKSPHAELTVEVSEIDEEALRSLNPSDYFEDVELSHIYAKEIQYLKLNRISYGFNSGKEFKPDNTIDRASLVTLVVKAKYPFEEINSCIAKNGFEGNKIFNDVDYTHHFAPFICMAKVNQIVVGYSSGDFGPERPIKAHEAIKIAMRTLDRDLDLPINAPLGDYTKRLENFGVYPPTINKAYESSHEATRGEIAYVIQLAREKYVLL